MYIQGKVIRIYDTQSGESTRGSWRKKEFILETFGKIPKKICMVLKGESIDTIALQVGDCLKVSVDIESREYKEKWYTEVRAWKVEPAMQTNEEAAENSNDHPF